VIVTGLSVAATAIGQGFSWQVSLAHARRRSPAYVLPTNQSRPLAETKCERLRRGLTTLDGKRWGESSREDTRAAVETKGPLHTVVRVHGHCVDEAGNPSCVPIRGCRAPTQVIRIGMRTWHGSRRPPQQEGSSIEPQPGIARAGRSCLRFDCGRQTRYVPSLKQKVGGIAPGVYVLRFWLRLDGVADQIQGTSGVRASIEYLLKDGQRAWTSTSLFRGTAPDSAPTWYGTPVSSAKSPVSSSPARATWYWTGCGIPR